MSSTEARGKVRLSTIEVEAVAKVFKSNRAGSKVLAQGSVSIDGVLWIKMSVFLGNDGTPVARPQSYKDHQGEWQQHTVMKRDLSDQLAALVMQAYNMDLNSTIDMGGGSPFQSNPMDEDLPF